MTNKYIETPNVSVNWDGKSSLSLTYTEIMTALGVYTVPKAGLVLTDDQKTLNELIEKTTSFNLNVFARVYYSKYGSLTYADISNGTIDDFLSINTYSYDDIKDLSSIALYGVKALTLEFKYEDYIQKMLEDSESEDADPQFTECTVYFTVEGPQVDGVSELYIVRMLCTKSGSDSDKDKEEKEDTGENNSDNTDTIIDVDNNIIDASNYIITVSASISSDTATKFVFINSMALTDILVTETQSFVLKSGFLHVYINPLCPEAFTLTIKLKYTNALTGEYTIKKKLYSYEPTGVNITNVLGEHVYKMNNPDVSYAILRANPKLTGNVKVVVDSSSNIYLDTFKISDTMSHRKYRHISVSSDTYYGKSLMTKFKDIPSTDFYKVPDRCYSLFTPAQTYKNMYFDTYNSGVSTNTDELYSENLALLAPLCVKRVMPDFFLIFKVDKTASDYDEASMSDSEKMNYFIRNGKLVKSYDMRADSNLGKYIRNIYDNAKSYTGDLFASYDTDNYNRFIGISMDRGVVTQAYESAYKQEEVNNQVALNDFFTLGFERNHLVSKDIVNFEFLFDDPEDEMFSVNTYFGLYVRLNKCSDEDFSCIGVESTEDSSVAEYLYDTSVNTFRISSRLSTIPQYAQLIYGVSTPTEFIRLDNSLEYSSVNDDFILKPYKNILTAEVSRTDSSKCKSFITVKLNNIFDVGDHVRVIVPEIKTMYEIIMSDKNSLDTLSGVYTDEHNLTEVITNYYNTNAAGWTIKRVGMFIPYKKNVINRTPEYNEETEVFTYSENSVEEEIVSQTEQLFFALKKFNEANVMTSWKYGDTTLSVISQYERTIFERICSTSGFVESQKNYIQSTDDEDKTLEFLGSVYPDKVILNTETNWQHFDNFYLYPLHFEFIGARMAYIMDFLKTCDISDDTVYSVKIDDLNIFDNKSIVYVQTDGSALTSALYNDIPVYTYKNSGEIVDSSLSYVRWAAAYDNLSNNVLNIRNPLISNSQISLYNTYKINAGICSILQVKDFDYNVLDADDALLDYEQDDVIGKKGEYAEQSVFNQTATNNDDNIPSYDIEDDTNYKYVESGKENTVLDELNAEIQEYIDALTELKIKYDNADAAYDNAKNELQTLLDDLPEDDEDTPEITEARAALERAAAHLDDARNAYYIYGEDVAAKENTVYTCIPAYRKTGKDDNEKTIKYDVFDVQSVYYKREIVFVHSKDSDGELDSYNGKFTWGATYTPESAGQINVPTGYSSLPIRTTSEESIKDYIDKYHIVNDSETETVRTAAWYNADEESVRSKFLETAFNKNHGKFDIPMLSQYCCKWKSVGTDMRGENYRLMYYDPSIDASSYYIAGPGESDCSTYIGYLYAPANSDGDNFQYTDTKKYISRSLNQTVMCNADGSTSMYMVKDFILNNNGAIDDLVYSAVMPDCRFSPVYLSGENTIEFISSGVKFRIRSNNDNVINFNNYSGYSVIFIVLPVINKNYKKSTELIIDETNNEMMFVWYNPAKTLKMGYIDDPVTASTGMTLYPVNTDFALSDLTVKYVRESENTDSEIYSSISIPDSFSIGSETMYYDGFRMVNADADELTPAVHDETDVNKTLEYRRSHKGVRLSSSSAYLYISAVQTDESAYSKVKTGGVSAELNSVKPLFDNIWKTFPYYSGGAITGINPIIQYDAVEDTATNSKIETLLNTTSGMLNTYIVTSAVPSEISADVSYSKLKSVVNNVAVYVKTADGVKDFTNVSNLLSITLIDPIIYYKYKNIEHNVNSEENRTALGRVHPTYAEPVMKNMFVFDYSTAERTNRLIDEYGSLDSAEKIDAVFDKSFDGANISIKNVNTIGQMWINKYTEDSNYCTSVIDGSTYYRLAVDVMKDYSVMHDPWFYCTYRKYSLVDYTVNKKKVKKEFYTNVRGYETGYELKSFFNSKAVVLNGSDGNTIEITSWKNTKISKSEKYIRLNITDSIIYNILFRSAYTKSWKALGNISNGNKIDYIKNTILGFININNKTKFTVATDYVKTNVLSFNTDYNDSASVITNFKNELKYENGKYYMYIYPEDMYTYYAKMIIRL